MPNVTTVRLSRADRQLLRDVVDAIRSLKPEEEVPEGKTRLVEDEHRIERPPMGTTGSFVNKRADWLRARGAG